MRSALTKIIRLPKIFKHKLKNELIPSYLKKVVDALASMIFYILRDEKSDILFGKALESSGFSDQDR